MTEPRDRAKVGRELETAIRSIAKAEPESLLLQRLLGR